MGSIYVLCHGCGSEIDPAALVCPVCTRPRSRKEILRDLQGSRDQAAAARTRPLKLFFGLLLVAGGLAAMRMGGLDKLKSAASPAPTAASAPLPAASGSSASSTPNPFDNGSPAQGALPYDPATRPATAASGAAAVDAAGPDPWKRKLPSSPQAKPNSAPAPPEENPGWRVTGVVYDLFSTKAVAGAALAFQDRSTGKVYKIKSGKDGRYKLTLEPSQGGYSLSVSHARYRPNYLEDSEPPLRYRSEAAREQAAYESAQSAILHVPIMPTDEGALRYDVVLIPRE